MTEENLVSVLSQGSRKEARVAPHSSLGDGDPVQGDSANTRMCLHPVTGKCASKLHKEYEGSNDRVEPVAGTKAEREGSYSDTRTVKAAGERHSR